LLTGYVVFAALFVGVATADAWPGTLVRPWYGEWWRLAGVVALLAPFLVGFGAEAVHSLVHLGWRRRGQAFGRPLAAAVAAISLLAALAGLRGLETAILSSQSAVDSAWHFPERVTEDDLMLYREAGRIVDPRDQVLNNWEDGSPWMYAVGGARPAVPYYFSVAAEPYWNSVVLSAESLDSAPIYCRFILNRRVTHALARKETSRGVANPLFVAAQRNNRLFIPLYAGPTGTLYRLDLDVLSSCAAHGT